MILKENNAQQKERLFLAVDHLVKTKATINKDGERKSEYTLLNEQNDLL